ncbi:MAG: MBL fold metallo-hydrolase, partial [Clostridia bacterium]|nr:MBL fold metallo-hydrolase [Clostridia bacterium]
MNCAVKVSDQIIWVGGNDRRLNLFENAYPIPRGISYNAYIVLDEKTVLVDTADKAIGDLFLENIEAALDGRRLDYVIVQHMEPDHAATLVRVCEKYPEATVVASAKAATMIGQFFGGGLAQRIQPVNEGDVLETGSHRFTFVMAPMVHWPEVMVTYEMTTKTLFSADAFGTFGAVSGFLFADEVDFERDWLDDARRYYANIVGKYGAPVQTLLKKASGLEIAMICPLHGPIWRENIAWYVDKYQKWSTYTPEEDGVLIAYASVYGHTENA